MNLKRDFVGAVLAFTVAAFVTPAYADTETLDGIEWTYNVSSGEAEILVY